ncbi:hypothetical protein TNCV_4837191 [Trichonephila clavipes]|nr:hypothetical protein TNCV_4837191 [Trichonephila clavipes]
MNWMLTDCVHACSMGQLWREVETWKLNKGKARLSSCESEREMSASVQKKTDFLSVRSYQFTSLCSQVGSSLEELGGCRDTPHSPS